MRGGAASPSAMKKAGERIGYPHKNLSAPPAAVQRRGRFDSAHRAQNADQFPVPLKRAMISRRLLTWSFS